MCKRERMWQIGWEGLCDKDSVLVDERECISVRAKRERERKVLCDKFVELHH